jgi:hypothetical protein
MANLHNRHWRCWYNDKQYRARRAHQLQKHPLCEDCLAQGRSTAVTIADHHPAHRGDINVFRTGPLRSVCKEHHDRKWADDQRGYNTAVDADGNPVDKRHPFHQDRS